MDNSQPLKTGSMITLWHGNRGNTYVILGYNRGSRTLSCIRHNCINNSGEIHAATRRAGKFHVEISVDDFLDGIKTAGKVNRVCGEKAMDRTKLQSFVRNDVGSRTLIALKEEHEVYPPLEAFDGRAATSFV